MKPPVFDYERPATLDETVSLLAEHGDACKVLAGGQSLVPLLNLRLTYPQLVVDLAHLDTLRDCGRTDSGARLGALVTHATIEDDQIPDVTGGLLSRVARGIGYRAVRNRGTLGGSLVHADPSAEWPVVFSALDATVTAWSRRGSRSLDLRTFYEGYFTTRLEADELVTEIHVPAIQPDRRTGFHKQTRKFGEFAESMAVAIIDLSSDGTIANADIWLGAASDTPMSLTGASQTLIGAMWGPPARNAFRDAVSELLGPSADREERYRTHLHGIAACRAIDDALEART